MKQNEIIELSTYHSPIGTLLLGSYEQLLCLCLWEESASFEKRLQKIQTLSGASFVHKSSPIIEETKRQLDKYFNKKRSNFHLPIHLWGTSFQQATWNELIKIPYGTTISYKTLAQKVGNEQAVRAVANANNKNFISIIVPCHRVIGSKGELVGYAGGLNKKAFLLQLEQQNQRNKSASLFKEDDFLK